METDTSCLPLRGRIGDDLSNPLVKFGRRGGHRPSHRESKKESREVKHNDQVSIKDKPLWIQEMSTALSRVERREKLEGTSSTRKGEVYCRGCWVKWGDQVLLYLTGSFM